MKTGTAGPTTRGGNALRCELCDVTCTGSDAYAAHIRFTNFCLVFYISNYFESRRSRAPSPMS